MLAGLAVTTPLSGCVAVWMNIPNTTEPVRCNTMPAVLALVPELFCLVHRLEDGTH